MPELNEAKMRAVHKIQIAQQLQFKSIPEKGITVELLGKKFTILRNVFFLPEAVSAFIEKMQINQDETVLDIGTGTGVIAIFSIYKGASKAVAIDINPAAVRNAKINSKQHGVADKIDIRLSDIFEAIGKEEKFDVITANLPFHNKKAVDIVEASMYDTNFQSNRRFLHGASKHLTTNGRIYMWQSNFGALEEMKMLATENGFQVKKIGENKMPAPDPRIFYLFELKKI